MLGASGLVGSSLLKYLLEDHSVKKISLFVRKKLDITNPKLTQIIVDYNNLESYSEFFQVDHIFCCLGTTIRTAGSRDAFKQVDFHYVIESAKLGKEKGVKNFSVVSAMGSNSKSRIFYNRVKGEMENSLQKIGFESLHIFRPSLLLGNRAEIRKGEKVGAVLSRVFSFAFIKGLKKYKPIQADYVAKAMIELAKNKTYGLQIIESDQMNI
ncbi:MAG: oxidoreductase [Leptospiraceae bacterium]|nr:oxidoreductase [Leptospiraceae bacterium]